MGAPVGYYDAYPGARPKGFVAKMLGQSKSPVRRMSWHFFLGARMIVKTQKAGGTGKSGTRKYGRNLKTCKRYRDKGQREKNKLRRLKKRKRQFARRRAKREKE